MSASLQPQTPEFGSALLLPQLHQDAARRAAACFAAIPELDMIAIWTKTAEPNAGACRLQHDHTWFWMERPNEDDDIALNLDDVADDQAAAACFRFSYEHKCAAHHLAAQYQIDDLVCVLIFHRSGNSYLVRNADHLFELTMDRIAALGATNIAPFIYPVFDAEPTGHQMMAWTDAVWQDLKELHQES